MTIRINQCLEVTAQIVLILRRVARGRDGVGDRNQSSHVVVRFGRDVAILILRRSLASHSVVGVLHGRGGLRHGRRVRDGLHPATGIVGVGRAQSGCLVVWLCNAGASAIVVVAVTGQVSERVLNAGQSACWIVRWGVESEAIRFPTETGSIHWPGLSLKQIFLAAN